MRVLAVDVGTSAVRAAVVDEECTVVAARRTARGEGVDLAFDADALWRQLVATIRLVPSEVRRSVQAVVIAGHLGVVLLDDANRPVGPACGWADTSGVIDLAGLVEGNPDLLRLTGRPVPTGGALATLLHVRSDDPRTFARLRWVLAPKDYLNARLTGVVATDHTSAAYTGACDVVRREWSEEIIDSAGLASSLFPSQFAGDAVIGPLLHTEARRLGLDPGVVVVAGGPDGTVGALPLCESRPDAIADIAGTTDAIVRLLGAPGPVSAGAVLNPYPLGSGWTVGGPTGRTGSATGIRSTTEDAAQLLDAVPPGADGLVVDPTSDGARFPRWDPAATGFVHGREPRHGAAAMVRASVEGAAYVVREGLDALDPARSVAVSLAGGQVRVAGVAQVRADVWGRTVWVSHEPDLTLRGAATLAISALGAETSSPAVRTERHDPDPDRVETYDRLYDMWRGLRP